MSQADRLGALCSARTGVGAVTEAEFVHLGEHGFGALFGLYAALRQEGQLADFGSHEEHSRAVLTSRSTCTASDAGSSIHSLISLGLGNRNAVGIGYTTCVDADETSGLHDLVVRATVHHKVFDYRERARAPRLNRDSLAIMETTHVELAGCYLLVGSVRVSVDIQRAHTADALSTIVVESDGVFVLSNQLFVEDVHHLQERSALENVLQFVGLEMTLCFWSGLTPNTNFDIDILIHNLKLLNH